MTDGCDPDLYTNFADVAQRTGVYTAIDYADILDFLVKRWELEVRSGEERSDELRERVYGTPMSVANTFVHNVVSCQLRRHF